MRKGCCDFFALAGNIAIDAVPVGDVEGSVGDVGGYDGSECGVAVCIIGTVLPRFLERGL
jgi:hypothetical protein